MRLSAGVAALVALMPAAPVVAQVAKPDTSQWAIAVELGLNAARGNSNFTTLASGLRFTHLNKKRYEAEWGNNVTPEGYTSKPERKSHRWHCGMRDRIRIQRSKSEVRRAIHQSSIFHPQGESFPNRIVYPRPIHEHALRLR